MLWFWTMHSPLILHNVTFLSWIIPKPSNSEQQILILHNTQALLILNNAAILWLCSEWTILRPYSDLTHPLSQDNIKIPNKANIFWVRGIHQSSNWTIHRPSNSKQYKDPLIPSVNCTIPSTLHSAAQANVATNKAEDQQQRGSSYWSVSI